MGGIRCAQALAHHSRLLAIWPRNLRQPTVQLRSTNVSLPYRRLDGGWLYQFMVERLGAWVGMEMPSLREFLLTLAERVSPTPELGRRIDPLRELTHILAE